jgi:hypothetical protein
VVTLPERVRFIGIVNRRPRFDFGDRVPPAWLLEKLKTAKVDENRVVLDGKPVLPGSYVEP